MWNLFDIPEEISTGEYLQRKKDEATVGLKDELGAYVSEGAEWNLSVRVSEWLGRHGDYQFTAEGAFDEVEFAEEYEKQRNTEVSKDDWVEISAGKENLKDLWQPGMNKLEADYLVRKDEGRRARDFIFAHREGGWRTIAGSALMLATQAVDPTAHIPIFGYGTKVNALGKIFGLSKLVKKFPVIGGFAVNAADAAVGTAIADTALIPWMRSEGTDTPWSAMAWDVMFSMGAAGVLTSAAHGLNRMTRHMNNLDTPGRKHQKALNDYLDETFGDEITPEDIAKTTKEYELYLKEKNEDPVLPEQVTREQKLQEDITEKANFTDEGIDGPIQKEFDARTETDLEELVARRDAGELDADTARTVTEVEELNKKSEAKAQAYEELLDCL
jgi:hypothetical protein